MQSNNHKILSINGMPDHIHILFGLRPAQSIADLMQDIKGSSSKWINNNKLVQSKFSWQEGYGAVSYSKADVPAIIQYIINQTDHHKRKTFSEEYYEMLKEFEVDFDDRFIFKPVNIDYSVPDGT